MVKQTPAAAISPGQHQHLEQHMQPAAKLALSCPQVQLVVLRHHRPQEQ
jgi:hypothetical protein